MSENITPAYREEKLLANIAGGDYDITPATRKEKMLADIAAGGGGLPDPTGASVGDVLTIGSDGPEWAAPSGGGAQLYGPYYITNSEAVTIADGAAIPVSLDIMFDTDGNQVTISGDYIPFIVGVNWPITGIPYGYSILEKIIAVRNESGASITITPYDTGINFYSTVEATIVV